MWYKVMWCWQYRVAQKTVPAYLIANILKTPWPNCVEIGELLQYYMLNTVINFFLFKNFIALWRHLAKTQHDEIFKQKVNDCVQHIIGLLQKSTNFHAIRSWSFRNICNEIGWPWPRFFAPPCTQCLNYAVVEWVQLRAVLQRHCTLVMLVLQG